MPRAEHGFKRAMIAMVMGFIFSAILDTMTPVIGLDTTLIRVGFNMLAISASLITYRNANYWGISYTLGYFLGLLVFGNFFMEPWELLLYAGIMGFYLVLKGGRRARARAHTLFLT